MLTIRNPNVTDRSDNLYQDRMVQLAQGEVDYHPTLEINTVLWKYDVL